MQDITVEASELWEYYEEHREELIGNMHLIAENSDYGTQVWLTVVSDDPNIVVEVDGEEAYREEIFSKKDAKNTAYRVYDNYLSLKAIERLTEEDNTVYVEDEEEYDEYQELMEEREDELDNAVSEFVNVASETGCYNMTDEMLDDLKEHFLEYISRKWGVVIYRPMYLEDVNTGEEYFTEYPYDDMEFDDDNPIYNQE